VCQGVVAAVVGVAEPTGRQFYCMCLCVREWSLQWWAWLSLLGVSFTVTLSIKYIGFFTAVLVLYMVARDFWHMVGDFTRSDVSICLVNLVNCI